MLMPCSIARRSVQSTSTPACQPAHQVVPFSGSRVSSQPNALIQVLHDRLPAGVYVKGCPPAVCYLHRKAGFGWLKSGADTCIQFMRDKAAAELLHMLHRRQMHHVVAGVGGHVVPTQAPVSPLAPRPKGRQCPATRPGVTNLSAWHEHQIADQWTGPGAAAHSTDLPFLPQAATSGLS